MAQSYTIQAKIGVTNPGASSPSFTDCSTRVRSISVRRGRQNELDRTETGTLTMLMENSDRVFDPTNTSGALYGLLLPMRKVAVAAVVGGTSYSLFNGFVESFGQTWDGNNVGWCTIQAADGLKVLAIKKLTDAVYPSHAADARITQILDDIGWSTVDRNLASGITILSPATASGAVTALSHIETAVQSENGRFFMSASGAVTFQNRSQPYASTVANATFGDSTAELGYTDISVRYDDSQIYNEVYVQSATGAAQISRDTATSQLLYLERTLSRTGQFQIDNNETKAAADFLLTNYKDARLRIESIGIMPETDVTGLYPQAFGRELGDRIKVIRRPPNSNATNRIEQNSFIEGIEHTLEIGKLAQTNFRLSAVGIGYSAGSPIILDNTTAGLIAVTSTTGVLVY